LARRLVLEGKSASDIAANVTFNVHAICGTITLSQPDPIPEFESLPAPPLLSRDAEEPVFAEPWQAQAFALAVKLSEQGHFTWEGVGSRARRRTQGCHQSR